MNGLSGDTVTPDEALSRLRTESVRLRNFALVFLVVDFALGAGWLLLTVHARFMAG